jgi:hypothetical protein
MYLQRHHQHVQQLQSCVMSLRKMERRKTRREDRLKDLAFRLTVETL